MDQEKLEEFAKIFVKNVRDRAIRDCDSKLFKGNPLSPIGKRWNDEILKGDFEGFANNVIADSVDIAIFYALLSIDEGLFNIIYRSENKDHDLGSEFSGELAGYYAGEWVEKFSDLRKYDDI